MKAGYFTLFALTIWIWVGCQKATHRDTLSGEQLAKAYCSSCHVFPEPSLLPRSHWENVLLPMGARLGISQNGYDPLRGKSMEEIFEIGHSGVFPDQAMLDDTTWLKLKRYFTENAPLALPRTDTATTSRQQLFRESFPKINLQGFPVITMVEFDTMNRVMYLADWNGHFLSLNADRELVKYTLLPNPVVDIITGNQNQLDILSIGKLYPNELANGAYVQLQSNDFEKQTMVIDNLSRPVFFEKADLNNDGFEDVVICGFGNLVGKLAWYSYDGQSYQENILKPVPGATRIHIEDLDQNGYKDLLVLFAQGDEGFSVFYNEEGKFTEKKLLRFHPLFGSNDFEFIDWDGDSDKDIILTNGDNGDYSNTLKPYHGVRIFENDGQFNFTEKFFFPQYGASKVRTRDYDKDGDYDLLIASFFPDHEALPSQSILYLEQIDHLSFKPYHFELSGKGRWMVMDAGDLDGDHDVDVAVGSFVLDSEGIPDSLLTDWRSHSNQLLFLENLTN